MRPNLFTKLSKKNMFLKTKEPPPPTSTTGNIQTRSAPGTVPILIEIVSAQITPQDHRKDSKGKYSAVQVLTTYCVVKDLNTGSGQLLEEFPTRSTTTPIKIQPKVIHKTKAVRKNNNPIWTVLTESLLLIHVSPDNLLELNEGKLEFELFHKDLNVVDKSLGSVALGKHNLLKGGGQRMEYALTSRTRSQNQNHIPKYEDSKQSDSSTDEPISSSSIRKGGLRGMSMPKVPPFLNRSEQQKGDSKGTTHQQKRSGGMLGIPKMPPFLQLPDKPMHGMTEGALSVLRLPGKAVQGVGSLLHLPDKSLSDSSSIIVLRFRRAEPHEVQFMKDKASSESFNLSMNLNLTMPKVPFFKSPGSNATEAAQKPPTSPKTKKIKMLEQDSIKKTISKPIIQPMERGIKTLKKVSAGVVQKRADVTYKVKPYPDPHDVRSTAWMTKLEMERVVLEPSRKWIQVGDCCSHRQRDGDLDKEETIGNLRVEILKCEGLPNLDTGAMGDLTDAFVAMVFENNVVRTDVVFDELSPRFMPWTQRAFAFSIQHPSSLLFLGVLDHDSVGDYDQIGRVVVDLSKFKGNTEYLLDYKLHFDPDSKDERGCVTIRLTIDWESEARALWRALSPPPPMRINVADKKTFRVVRYLCRGKVDMEKATLTSIKQYAYEILDYVDSFYYFIDIMAKIVLWRGRIVINMRHPLEKDESKKITKLNLWFPIESVFVFSSVLLAIDNPSLIPSIFFFSIAIAMCTICCNRSKHPSPWKRCESVQACVQSLVCGQNLLRIDIDPYAGHEASSSWDKLDQVRIDRVKELLFALQTLLSKIQEEKTKLDPYHYLAASEDKRHFNFNLLNFAQSPLNCLHLGLGVVCSILRVLRGIVNWDSYHYSFAIMVYCLLIGTAFCILPINCFFQWTCRIFVFAFLGPWNHLIDIYYFMPYYPPTCKDTEEPKITKPNFDTAFESSGFMRTKQVRMTQEDAVKMKDMREYLFGKFMETVPAFDSSRYHSIPEPNSSARTLENQKYLISAPLGYQDASLETPTEWQHLPGQNLKGGMIPRINPMPEYQNKMKIS